MLLNRQVKGTVSVIWSDPPSKDGNVQINLKCEFSHNYVGSFFNILWHKNERDITGLTLWPRETFSWLEKCLFLGVSPFLLIINKKCASHFRREENPQMKINSLKKKWYLVHTFKGTVVNRALSSLHGGPLEITLTVFLIRSLLQEIY